MPDRDYYLPSRHLVSQEDKAIVESARVPRSRFVGEKTRKTTFDAGYLVPFFLDEILPGDHMSYECQPYVRMSTPLFPIFDNQRVDTHWFFVPYRLVWTNWPKLMGEQDNPGDSIAYTIPQIVSEVGGYELGSIYDHMGLPIAGMQAIGDYSHSALPLRAYYQIWNAWFRDQNVMSSVVKNVDDGPDLYTEYALLKRAKAPDYFTVALPWPQKFTAINPLAGGSAPVVGIGGTSAGAQTGPATVRESDLATDSYAFFKQVWDGAADNQVFMKWSAASNGWPEVFADLNQATGVTINTLRTSFLVQDLLERDARGGTRYVELIRSHFGVTNPDFRLQRPEYIGGGQTPLNITPIAQTAPTAGATVGALGAAGTAAGTHRASYAATEHGLIIGLISIRSDMSYQQGMHRMWTRTTRYDFPFPSLMGLGEQAILRQELYVTGTPSEDTTVFGYQERWHEFRTMYSDVTGYFRSNLAGTLDEWHLAQYFSGAPTLSQGFLVEDPPMSRVLAAAELAENQQYLASILIRRTAVRPISIYGTPSQLSRF